VALLGPFGLGQDHAAAHHRRAGGARRGSVLFHGEDATDTDVRERNVGFVFQHYALFGHMTIFENVAFGLRCGPRRTRPTEAEIRAR
jgi:sulfate/thiosulfate transport system ATP-binding protein